MAIVDGALSAKQAEVDAAKASLAQRDASLALLQTQKLAVEAQIPPLQAQAKAADTKAQAAQTVVTAKTAEVVAYANKAAEKESEAGSLGALLTKAAWIVGILLALLFLANFILPSLAAEFPAVSWLVKLNQTTKSITSAHP